MILTLFDTYRIFNNPISYIEVILWIITMTTSFLIASYTLYKIISGTEGIRKLQKLNLITWTIFFFLFVVAIFIQLYWKYFISDDELADFLDTVSYILFEIAFFIKILFIEYSINSYKYYKGYYFSVIFIILIILTTFIFPEPVGELELIDIIYIALFILGTLIFPLIFIYIAIKLKGKERKMALKICFGYVLLIIGILFQPQNLEINKTIIPNFDLVANILFIICPILLFFGILIMYQSYSNIFHPNYLP